MKKLIFPLLCLFLLSFASAQAKTQWYGIGGRSGAAACSDNEGNESNGVDFLVGADTEDVDSDNHIICYQITLTCSGTPTNQYFYGAYYNGAGTPAAEWIMAIYSDTGANVPYQRQAYTTLAGDSGGDGPGWYSSAYDTAGSIGPGTYWLCTIAARGDESDIYTYYSSTSGGVTKTAVLSSFTAPTDISSESWTSITHQMSTYTVFP